MQKESFTYFPCHKMCSLIFKHKDGHNFACISLVLRGGLRPIEGKCEENNQLMINVLAL